jgi:hypothetical protein
MANSAEKYKCNCLSLNETYMLSAQLADTDQVLPDADHEIHVQRNRKLTMNSRGCYAIPALENIDTVHHVTNLKKSKRHKTLSMVFSS